VVLKIKEEYYLTRAEAVSYVLQGYKAKWCFARWSGGEIALSFESMDGNRQRLLLTAYKTKQSKTVRIRKVEIDGFFTGRT
jgi:hypothetical protein